MKNVWLTGLLVPGILFVWSGVSLKKRAQKRGEPAGCACLLCFLCAAVCLLGALKGICEIAPLEFFGLLFGGTGGSVWWGERRFFKRAIIIPGVVTDYKTRETRQERFRKEAVSRGFKSSGGELISLGSPRETPMYAPVVQFEFAGQIRQITGTVYSSSKPKMGAAVKVGVDPQNIEAARILSKFSFGVLFFVIGLLLLATAVYVRLAGIK